MQRLFIAVLFLIGGVADCATPACKAEQIIMRGQPICWHITLSDRVGHKFVVIQMKNSLDLALNSCKQWMKKQAKKPK